MKISGCRQQKKFTSDFNPSGKSFMAIYIDQKESLLCRYCESCVPLHLKISNLKFDHFKQLDAVYYVDMALSINTDYHQCHFFQFKKQTFLPSSVECSRQICGSFHSTHPKLKKICIIKTQKKKIK